MQLEGTVIIVQALVRHRFGEIRRVVSVHAHYAHETQDPGPAACVRTLVSGYTSIEGFGLRPG